MRTAAPLPIHSAHAPCHESLRRMNKSFGFRFFRPTQERYYVSEQN
jgi:hypothetical protein